MRPTRKGNDANQKGGIPDGPLFYLMVFLRMLDPVYQNIQEAARRMVQRCPEPDFYKDHADALQWSDDFFQTDPVVLDLVELVSAKLENNFGHGMKHSKKVAQEAGALMIVECRRDGQTEAFTKRTLLVVQCAGLLHDIHRKEKDHAARGAEFAKEILPDYPFSVVEIDDVFTAIYNHEAFGKTIQTTSPGGMLVSGCLYDADKFRWGPDNFTDTVWEMIAFLNPPIGEFIKRYPQGMKGISRIRDTFRTPTGKKYGPQFIDIGLLIGEQLYAYLREEFTDQLD
jgi:hypothetical protein